MLEYRNQPYFSTHAQTNTASYWNKDTTTQMTIASSPDSDGKTTTELQVAAPSTTVYVGWDIAIWRFATGQYPRLINVPCADHQYNPEAACTSTLAP